MLTDQGILSRRLKYLCCSLDYLSAAIDARIHGDRKCYEENKRKWLWMSWAADIMQDTPVGDEDGCTLLPFATDVADKADCLCDICGCPTPTTSCTITPNYTVLEALAFADLPVDPPVDSEYYVISGSTLGLGMIASWNGATYDYTAIPNGSIVWATVTNDYWTNTGSGPGPYFPAPLLTNISPDLWWADQDPDVTAQGRDIQLQALGPSGWYNVAAITNESDLPQQVNLTGLPVTDPNGIRWNYIVEDCTYPSTGGSFEPPIEPPVPCTIIPAWTVDQNADASEEFTLPSGTYLILTNNGSVVNGWSGHVGEISFPDGSFAVPPVGATIWNVQEGVYWFLFGSGWAPLFPPVLITPDLDGTAFIESAYPAATAENDRQVIVTATSPGGSVFVLWSGTEQDLPVTVPAVGIDAPASVIYIGDDACVNTAPAEVGDLEEPDTIICGDAPQVFMWTPSAPGFYSFLFTGSSLIETLEISFAGGTMDAESTIAFYDSEGGTPFSQTPPYATDVQGYYAVSPTNQLWAVFTIGPDFPFPQEQPFWWQVSCTSGYPVTATGYPVDDCDEWEFSVNVDVAATGLGSDVTIEILLDGVAEPDVTGAAIGVTTIGPYPIGSEVVVTVVDPLDPAVSVLLGAFYGGLTCDPENDPCLPAQAFKADGASDLADIPTSNPGPQTLAWYILSDVTGLGTWPVNSIIVLPPGTTWELGEANIPAGSIIFTGGVYYISQGGTLPPLFLYPPGVMWPIGGGQYAFSLDYLDTGLMRPVCLEVRTGMGPWAQVWSGLEPAITGGNTVTVTPGEFTEARMVWNCGVCPVYRTVFITPTPP